MPQFPAPGDGGHDVESVRAPVIARLAVPRASTVFHFDPDVILLDVSMPHLNGFEAAKHTHGRMPAQKSS